MVTEKFNKDFAKGNKNISKVIEDIVADYFLKEKVTEASLRNLKAQVAEAIAEYKKNSPSVKGSSQKGSQTSKQDQKQREEDLKSNKPEAEQEDKKSKAQKSKEAASEKGSADSSSVASKSVYYV
jgi:hypothetical protein